MSNTLPGVSYRAGVVLELVTDQGDATIYDSLVEISVNSTDSRLALSAATNAADEARRTLAPNSTPVIPAPSFD